MGISMRLYTEETAEIPKDVTVTVEKKTVIVKGPRGTLRRTFKGSKASVSVDGETLRVDMWFGAKLQACVVRTICSHIKNMITDACWTSSTSSATRHRATCARPRASRSRSTARS